MSFKHLLFPQTIKFPDSRYNEKISLHLYFRQPTLIVGGLIQSGDILTSIWKKGIKSLIPKLFSPKNILLLGLGGGSNALLVSKLYPLAHITAVEIDPVMIDISRKYFGTSKIKKLQIINADALDFARNLKSEKYDLILVDCFEGKYIPKKLENLDFIQSLKVHSRYTLINRIFWYEYHHPTQLFMRSLATRFFFITTHTRSNLIISLI